MVHSLMVSVFTRCVLWQQGMVAQVIVQYHQIIIVVRYQYAHAVA